MPKQSTIPTQHRQQLGWQTAQQAAQLLKEDFAVKKVVLFGSILHAQHIRPSSDIDLAVWGLPSHAYSQAVSQLFRLDSSFSIDLVLFEQAPLSLRQSIERTGIELSDNPESAILPSDPIRLTSNMTPHHAVLVGLIRQNLSKLAQLTENTQQLSIKYQQTKDEDYLGTLALNLHGFYSGAERIFREVAITPTTRTLLEDYCAFRHVVRSIYTMQLKEDRIQPPIEALPTAFAALRQDCESFCDSLTTDDSL